MFEVNNRNTRCCSGLFIVNFEHIWRVVPVFLLTLKTQMPDGILYCLDLNLSVSFRVRFRSRTTFKKKFYVTTVTNSFQPLPIFCHKEVHLRCCIKLELNIVTWSTKILKGIRWHHPWLSEILRGSFALGWGGGAWGSELIH